MMRRHNAERCVVFTTAQLYRHDRWSCPVAGIQARTEGWVAGSNSCGGPTWKRSGAGRRRPSLPPAGQGRGPDAHGPGARSLTTSTSSAARTTSTLARLADGISGQGLSPDDDRVSFAQLLGMSDNLSFNLRTGDTPRRSVFPTAPCARPFPTSSAGPRKTRRWGADLPG